MVKEFPPDEFTENDVKAELDAQGLHYQDKGRYILAQCPTHDDKHPSVQIYKDDWFVNCHANCGRYHITKAFPNLRPTNNGSQSRNSQGYDRTSEKKQVTERTYEQFDLYDEWKEMDMIPRDHVFKGIPLDILDDLGWRWNEDKNSYFIPYFSSARIHIPFAQWRHLSGERRFTFLKDAKPTAYGTWNLIDTDKIFIVEGTSDAAVLEHCMIPWVAMPSAASGELIKKLAQYAKENGIQLIYGGDNDEAGDKLKEALDSVSSYRIHQPPKQFKDWGEFFESEGALGVINYCNEELDPTCKMWGDDVIGKTAQLMGGGTEISIVGSSQELRKEQPGELPIIF